MRLYWPVIPNGRHNKFRIMSREDGKLKQVKNPKLDSINSLYLQKIIDAKVARRQVEEIVEELRKVEAPDAPQYLQSNLDIFDRYFTEEYEDRDILPDSLETARSSFKRAINLLGKIEIPTADQKKVQKKIYNLPYKKRAPIVTSLNALFKFVGRNLQFEVGVQRGGNEPIHHLSVKEFAIVYPLITNPIIAKMAGATFATGGRVGELFAVRSYNQLKRTLSIQTQIDRKKGERATKTYRTRTSVVIKELEQYLQEWILVPAAERLTIRNLHIGDYLANACMQAFPEDPTKWCHFLDMRHSYAIHFLSVGVSIDLVATSMGNSPTVCRKHYVGYVLSDEGVDLINIIQNKR